LHIRDVDVAESPRIVVGRAVDAALRERHTGWPCQPKLAPG
jgi:hypothetical protein